VFQPTNPGPGDTDTGKDIKVGKDGNAYVAGSTSSNDFPTTPNAFQPTNPGGGTNAFVTKLNADGSALVYSTYLGGSSGDLGSGLAVDGNGNAYVAGGAFSQDFPTTPDALEPAHPDKRSRWLLDQAERRRFSAILLHVSRWRHFTNGNAIATDEDGNVYITGETSSKDFPTTTGAFEPSHPNLGSHCSFVVKFGNDDYR
jgi:hypothetical protein